jgi:hypothetical protein
MASLQLVAIIVSVIFGILGLLSAAGAFKFFTSVGTRLTMVEKESADTRQKVEKQGTELIAANLQVAAVAAALEGIRSALNELKSDVKDWMRTHGHSAE